MLTPIQEISSRLKETSGKDSTKKFEGRTITFYNLGLYLLTGSFVHLEEYEMGDLEEYIDSDHTEKDSSAFKDLPKIARECDGTISGYSVNDGGSGFAYKGKIRIFKDVGTMEEFLKVLPKLPGFQVFTFKAWSDTLFSYSNGNNHILIAFDND